MTVREIIGDLFNFNVDAIGHGVNCKGVMGAGIAAAFKSYYPEMYESYYDMCNLELLDLGQVFVWHTGRSSPKLIYNMATQFNPGPNAELEAIAASLYYVRYHAERNNLKSVALPQIGCGIGGLDWNVVKDCMAILCEPSPVEFQFITFQAA